MPSVARVAGMAGEAHVAEVTAYLSRLTGEALSPEQPLRLRSVHRAALASWARKQRLPISLAVARSGAPFRIRELLDADATASIPVPAPALAHQAARIHHHGPVSGIGIDMEDVDALPHADDFREHAFFQDNFTPAEIAYCVRQADARASFCGTWAAKEAVLKSGLVAVPSGRLDAIEITRDDRGQPGFPGCQLSISHTARAAVAMCVAMAPAAAPTEPARAPAGSGGGTKPEASRWRRAFKPAAITWAALATAGGAALSLAFHAAP